MKHTFRGLSLILSMLMVLSCLAGMTLTITASADDDGLTNVALNQKVTATSDYIPPEGFFAASMLVDGQWGTFAAIGDKLGWNSDPMTPTAENDVVDIVISLDKTYDISRIVIKPMQWASGDNYPRDYELQFSADGENWKTVASETGAGAHAESNTAVKPFEYAIGTETANFFRFHITKHSTMVDATGAYTSALGEIELWGKVSDKQLSGDARESSMDVQAAIDFGVWSEDPASDFGFANPNGVHVAGAMNSGYVTFVAENGDPYVWLGGKDVDALKEISTKYVDYAVIKYRTTTQTGGEFFVQRADGINPGQPGSHAVFSYVGDGEWHTVVVDMNGAWGGVDTKLTIFRIDPMAGGALTAGSEIDISYIKFFSNAEAAEAYAAAETVTKHVKGELNEGDPAIFLYEGEYYTADEYLILTENRVEIDPPTAEYTTNGGGFSGDTFFLTPLGGTEQTMKDGQGFQYISDVMGGVIKASEYQSFAVRGWYGCGDAGEIQAYGYALGDSDPVFSADFINAAEDAVKNAAGTEYATRFKVTVPTINLPEGTYNVYVLVKHTNGEVYRLTGWGDFAIIVGEGKTFRVEGLTDGEGNALSLNGNRVLNAKGVDTGLTLRTLDDGRMVGVSHLIPLTYQDPLAGALTVGDKKYTYEQKIAVTPVYVPVDPEDTSVPSDNAGMNACPMSPDTLFLNNAIVKDGAAHAYIANTLGGVIRDTDRTMQSFSLRGWAHTQSEDPIVAYGYALNNGEIMWNALWVIPPEAGLAAAAGGANTTRYKIDVDVTGLADGVYNVYAFVKTESGDVRRLAAWGDFKFIKGGENKLTGYTDGSTSYGADSLLFTEGETTFVLLGAVDVTAGAADGSKGKYIYDRDISFVAAPEAPFDPHSLNLVYLLDGEGLNTLSPARMEDAVYDYEAGCVRYVSTAGDPNAGSAQIPAGTTVGRYMVVMYRTECAGARGEVFTGSGAGATGDSNVPFPGEYVADGEWHYLIADLARSHDFNTETGVINHFRNDCLQGGGQWVEIRYYAFFNTMAEAEYYAANDLHVLPTPAKIFTATFKADGEVIKVVEFKEGDEKLSGVPKVPVKDGFEGAWEEYTLADADLVINAVYTKVGGGETEPETKAPADENAGKFDTLDHLYNFYYEANKSHISANQCSQEYNDDGSITFTGKWKYTDDNSYITASFSINYVTLMQKCYKNYDAEIGSNSKLPNKSGTKYSVFVVKAKTPECFAGERPTMNVTVGKNTMCYVDAASKTTAAADGEYLLFDFSKDRDITTDFIYKIELVWADDLEITEASVGAAFTLYDVYLFENVEAAEKALNIEWPKPEETTKKEVRTEEPTEAPTQPDTTPETQPEASGCKSVLSAASALALTLVTAAAVTVRKKKED